MRGDPCTGQPGSITSASAARLHIACAASGMTLCRLAFRRFMMSLIPCRIRRAAQQHANDDYSPGVCRHRRGCHDSWLSPSSLRQRSERRSCCRSLCRTAPSSSVTPHPPAACPCPPRSSGSTRSQRGDGANLVAPRPAPPARYESQNHGRRSCRSGGPWEPRHARSALTISVRWSASRKIASMLASGNSWPPRASLIRSTCRRSG